MVSVNTNNLTEEERAAFLRMPGSIKTSGWFKPAIADKVLRALYEMEPLGRDDE